MMIPRLARFSLVISWLFLAVLIMAWKLPYEILMEKAVVSLAERQGWHLSAERWSPGWGVAGIAGADLKLKMADRDMHIRIEHLNVRPDWFGCILGGCTLAFDGRLGNGSEFSGSYDDAATGGLDITWNGLPPEGLLPAAAMMSPLGRAGRGRAMLRAVREDDAGRLRVTFYEGGRWPSHLALPAISLGPGLTAAGDILLWEK